MSITSQKTIMSSPGDSFSDDLCTSGGRPSSNSQQTDHSNRKDGSRRTKGAKKRIRNWSADDRAVHRVFERSRREAFKERLQSLAALVPTLQTVEPSRLSKHVVIDETIDLIKSTSRQVADSQSIIDTLLAERQQLMAELNACRSAPAEPFQVDAMQLLPDAHSVGRTDFGDIRSNDLGDGSLLPLASPIPDVPNALSPPPRHYPAPESEAILDASALWQLSDLVEIGTSGSQTIRKIC